MNRIINIVEDKVQMIRGYLFRTTKGCGTGTCSCGPRCHNNFSLENDKIFKFVAEDYYELGFSK